MQQKRSIYRVSTDDGIHIKTLSSIKKAQALVIALYQSNLDRVANGETRLVNRRYEITKEAI